MTCCQYLEGIIQKKSFTRDYGAKQVEVCLDNNIEFKNFLEEMVKTSQKEQEEIETRFLSCDSSPSSNPLPPPKKKRKRSNLTKLDQCNSAMAELAASLQVDHFKKVFQDWSEIALVIRNSRFKDDEDQKIDVFDVKCKLWGQLLLHLFGVTLGCGDYGHLTVNHSAMLFRTHRSFADYSNQGFEASHKVHRALFSRATNHDQQAVSQSVDQILTHWLAEMMLSLRLQFFNAQKCIEEGKSFFHFRGCGWTKKHISWSEKHKEWIFTVNILFKRLFGEQCHYVYTKENGTQITKNSDPREKYSYDHKIWEENYAEVKENRSTIVSRVPCPKEKDLSPPICTSTSSLTDHDKTNLPATLFIDLSQSTASLPRTTESSQFPRSACLTSSIQRIQFSEIDIPDTCPSWQIKRTDIEGCFESIVETNPFTLLFRPPETVLSWADEEVKRYSSQKKITGVRIGHIGTFSTDGLYVLKKYCEVARVKLEVESERQWFSTNDGLTNDKTQEIKDVLWKTKMSHTVFKINNKSIDVQTLSNLVQERYLDNFVIDIVIMKYVVDASAQGNNQVIAFPSETFLWLTSQDEQFQSDKISNIVISADFGQVKLILVPVHMNAHWGLLVVDLVNKRFLFDDGLHLPPPSNVLDDIKKVLTIIHSLHPDEAYFKDCDWINNVNSFQRFGMPNQPSGSGSCGVAVILAAKDFINYGETAVHNFKWKFQDMRSIRKSLMSDIIRWGNSC